VNVIERAIDIAEERGLAEGMPVTREGKVCTLGALCLAAGVDESYLMARQITDAGVVELLPDLRPAIESLAKEFRLRLARGNEIWENNDRTIVDGHPEDVLEAMRYAAKRLAADS
jgi:hypothetical protein